MNNTVEFQTFEQQTNVYTVSQLNREVGNLLRDNYFSVTVEGEISNLVTPASGHLYFTLKDSSAQIRCALFRGQRRRINCEPTNGMLVKVRGELGLFEPRGDFQLIAHSIEEAGEGALRRALEKLQGKLRDEGLFSPEAKKPLPVMPQTIGVITSATGAAIRDILTVLHRRFPIASVIIYPALVQGEQAAESLHSALSLALERHECDVLILARGGGSLEDLWPFNDERLARSIFQADIPVISGVGHEVDFTICDAVADLRAATPSAAAEAAVPDIAVVLKQLAKQRLSLVNSTKHKLLSVNRHVDWLLQRLNQQHPQERLIRHGKTLQKLYQRLLQTMIRRQDGSSIQLRHLQSRLSQCDLVKRVAQQTRDVSALEHRLIHAIQVALSHKRMQLLQMSQGLDTVSPLATLSRGYAIVQDVKSGEIIRNSQMVAVGDNVKARLGCGELICQVRELKSEN